MTEKTGPSLRIASKKPLRSDGVGSFFEEYSQNEPYYGKLEFKLSSGNRVSINYFDISEINYTYLDSGKEDISLYCPNKYIIRIIGKNFDQLFDKINRSNVKWIRELRDNEEFDEESFFVTFIAIYRLDDWLTALDEIETAIRESSES